MQRVVYLVLMVTSGIGALRGSEEFEHQDQVPAVQQMHVCSAQRFQGLSRWPLSFIQNCSFFNSFGFTERQLPAIVAFACKPPGVIVYRLLQKFPEETQRRKLWREQYDWVRACYLYEPCLLKRSFEVSVELIKELNEAIMRTTDYHSGQLRTLNGMRMLGDASSQEKMLTYCIGTRQNSFAVRAFYDDKTPQISVDDLYEFLSSQEQLNMFGCVDINDLEGKPFSFHASDADYDEIKSWATEQGRDEVFDVREWFSQRFHFHPPAESVEERINKLVMHAKTIEHPVAQACFLFMYLVKLHPFFDGNRRTLRLLVALVLGRAGVQPVRISQRNMDQYEDLYALVLNGRSPETMREAEIAFRRFFLPLSVGS